MIRAVRMFKASMRGGAFTLGAFLLAAQGIGVGVVLLVDDPQPYYATLAEVAPTWAWGAAFVMAGSLFIRAYGRILESPGDARRRRQFFAPCLGLAMLYAAIGAAYTLTAGLTTALPGYAVDAVGCLIILVLTEPPLWARRVVEPLGGDGP